MTSDTPSDVLQRADKLLVEQGLVSSRTQAQRLLEAGKVELWEAGRWRGVARASEKLAVASSLRVESDAEQAYVSRGGLKLEAALQAFGITPRGMVVMDLGQSTGGFTDCLLQQGAARVVGVDVGRDQLALKLRQDHRVVCLEGINGRELPHNQLLAYAPKGFPLVVMDVSFISQTLILPGLAPLLAPAGYLISLVKPQFEVGKAGVGKGGIVRDARLYPVVEANLREACENAGLEVQGYRESPITGTDGNREFLICARRST